MNSLVYWSRLPGFSELTPHERHKVLSSLPLDLCDADFLPPSQSMALLHAENISENVLSFFSLPFSIAPNFLVDGQPVLVPMVTEEPSIVAACSKMAKIVGGAGGFFTEVDRPLITGQIQIYDLRDIDNALKIFANHRDELWSLASSLCQGMARRGGGMVDIGIRVVASDSIGPMILIEPVIDVVDAMGANIVNSLLENLSDMISQIFGGTMGIRILSNLCDRRMAKASCELPFRALATDPSHDNGLAIAKKMMAAHALADVDIYRACTHNKGILNGIDAVAIATGNDFRAIEAGAHAYAALSGTYKPLTRFSLDMDKSLLRAELALPLAIGVVGGLFSLHTGVQLSQKILGPFAKSSKKLSAVMVSAGLSQCLAALFALCTEGIQKGHMRLHHKKLQIGPSGDA